MPLDDMNGSAEIRLVVEIVSRTASVQTAWPRTVDEPGQVDATTDLLIRARGFIERGWCQNAAAKNTDGIGIDPRSERAVAWCPAGAHDWHEED